MEQIETFINENLMPYAWSFAMAVVIFVIGIWVAKRISIWCKGLLN